jgi:hypothetical protein
MHQKGIDYNETFAPTYREDTLKVLLSLAVKCKWQLKQMDVGSAFTSLFFVTCDRSSAQRSVSLVIEKRSWVVDGPFEAEQRGADPIN